MTLLAKKRLYWVAVVFLLFVLFSALRFGIAELFSMSGQASMERWKSGEPSNARSDLFS